MDSLKFNLTESSGEFKPMNAVNGGPWHRRYVIGPQSRNNLESYKAARIPYARNHDSAFHAYYGGPFSHDITKIFPNFDADPNNPESYDFACTDEAILSCMDAGTKCFFRLGESIEHLVKKHSVVPPKDIKKWAVICEHIVRHYTEKWANGYEFDMPYWEIWNEPDLHEDKPDNRPTWTGTRFQFFDLYATTAKHLKKCFPYLKIGGPALANKMNWAEDFLCEMEKRQVPIDFFSWHCYCAMPQKIIEKAEEFRALLEKYHYEDVESILNEWNYVRNWTDAFQYNIMSIHGIKGAAFSMACMSLAQASDSIDMLMYYDAHPSIWNGLFDFYTAKPLKGYYPFYWYGMFYDMKYAIKAENSIQDIYSLCGVDENGKVLSVITYYSDDDTRKSKEISVDFGKEGLYEIYLLDEEHDGELVATTNVVEFKLKLNSVILIKEILR